MDKKTVFLMGGSGFVGSHIAEKLIEKGYAVKALSRNADAGFLPPEAEIIPGDILAPDKWKDEVKGSWAVINLVGAIREFPKLGVTFKNLHVEGARNAVEVCRVAGVTRYLHMSAAGASPDGVSDYQITKYEGESVVRISGLDYTIFRPSLIFGYRDHFLNEFVKYMLSLSAFPIIGDGLFMLQPVYVGDVAEVFVRCLDFPDSRNKTFCLGGERVYAYKELTGLLASAIGGKIFMPRIPVKIMKITAKAMGRFRFYPITEGQLDMLIEGNVCPESYIFKTLGIRRLPMDKYIEDTFSHYRLEREKNENQKNNFS